MSRGSARLAEVIRQFADESVESPFALRRVVERIVGGYKVERVGGAYESGAEETIDMSLDDRVEADDVVVVVQLIDKQYLILGRL